MEFYRAAANCLKKRAATNVTMVSPDSTNSCHGYINTGAQWLVELIYLNIPVPKTNNFYTSAVSPCTTATRVHGYDEDFSISHKITHKGSNRLWICVNRDIPILKNSVKHDPSILLTALKANHK